MAKGNETTQTPPLSPEELKRLAEEKAAGELAEQERLKREQEKPPKRVEVIGDGVLGHLLLQKGEVTDDADYVALLDSERGQTLVREIL